MSGAVAVVLMGCTPAVESPEPSPPPTPTSPPPEEVTITWVLDRGDPLDSFWRDVSEEFMADHPHVTVAVEVLSVDRPPIDVSEWDISPDVLPAGFGWERVARVQAGQLRDLTDDVQEELAGIGAAAALWQLDGRTYGLPYSFSTTGVWYNTELFAAAGVDSPPATLDELYEAIDALKATGVAPIAVNGGAAQPGTWEYWDLFVLRTCSPEVLERARTERDFDDPCFVEAGDLLQELVGAEPFHQDYRYASSSSFEGSAESLVATGQAAMILGHSWTPAVMGGVLVDQAGEGAVPQEYLGWFPFPAIEGAAGESTAVLGNGSGFAVAVDAPDAAVDLVKYVVSVDVQARMTTAELVNPVRAEAQRLADPLQQPLFDAQREARYASEHLKSAYGILDSEMLWAVMDILRGEGSAQAVVDAMTSAAETP